MTSRVILALALVVAAEAATSVNRIVGGNPTTIDRYPWIVQVESLGVFSGVWSQSCAASILTTRYVLSAAHCFDGILFSPAYRRIRAGSTYRNTGGVISYVAAAYNHPSYGQLGFNADISVVRLSDPLVYTPVVQAAIIAAPDTLINDNMPVVYAGWGITEQGGSAASALHYTTVYTINNTLCAERYLTLPSPGIVTENMICAGLLDVGGRDACQGDFGGPMNYGNLVIGIASWGHGCANATFPSVSTAVSPFTNWIIETAV